jgi:hypothetical protein
MNIIVLSYNLKATDHLAVRESIILKLSYTN